jgi:hypothetical protein
MSTSYLGLQTPDYADPADVPAAIRQLVASGPIPRFPNAGNRNAAIPAPAKGAIAYLEGLNKFTFWDGSGTGDGWRDLVPALPSQWRSDNMLWVNDSIPANAIDKVHAKDIQSGGSSGVIPVTAFPSADLDTKGILTLSNSTTVKNDTQAPTIRNLNELREDVALKANAVMRNVTAVQSVTGPVRFVFGDLANPGIQLGSASFGIFQDIGGNLQIKFGSRHVRFSEAGASFLPANSNQLGIGGNDYYWTNVVANNFVNISDPSLKEIEGPLIDVMERVRKVTPINFKWKQDPDAPGLDHIGLNAAEVFAAFPTAVEGKPGNFGIKGNEVSAVLWAAIRELDHRLTEAGF